MTQYMTSAGLVISSIVVYQLCMKSVPAGLNPMSALATIFTSALICTFIASRLFAFEGPSFSFSEVSWQAALVGVAIVGIELGYLLMYRSGWTLAAATLIGMGGAAVLLAIIGAVAFQQPLSLRYILGIALCISGLYLLAPRA